MEGCHITKEYPPISPKDGYGMMVGNLCFDWFPALIAFNMNILTPQDKYIYIKIDDMRAQPNSQFPPGGSLQYFFR